MSRIPRGLKKRLEGSLENLSPTEAARLFVIYAQEADKKGVDVSIYPPVVELLEAWKGRLDRSRGKPDEGEAVADHNAFAYLRNVFAAANDVIARVGLAVAFDCYQVMSGLLLVLMQDATTEAIRYFRARMLDALPAPVTPEEYDRLVAWAGGAAFYSLNDAVEIMLDHDNALDNLSEAEYDAEADRLFDELVAKLEAGELVGGEGLGGYQLDSPVLVEEGKIPAWAALRLAWEGYMTRHNLRVVGLGDFALWSPERADRIERDGARLGDKELRDVAAAFYRDCRRRPWGKGLAPKPDLDDLVKLLTQGPNPFLHLKPFDFGRVEWEAFAASETDRDGAPFETETVATVSSLNALDEGFRRGERFGPLDYYRERFYPTTDPAAKRADFARVFAMLDGLESSRQPFTYDRAADGEMTISELMGVKFLTRFEQQVENLRMAKGQLTGLRAAAERVAETYFGGLPILFDEGAAVPIRRAEDYLASAGKALNEWLDNLAKYPWGLDVEPYRVGDVAPDEGMTADIVGIIKRDAATFGRFTKQEAAEVERRLGIG